MRPVIAPRDVAQRLLDAGADPSARDREGRTPIDVAPAPDSTPTVNVLRAASAQQQEPAHKEPRGGRRPGKTAEEYTHEFAAKLTQQIEAGTAPWQKSWKRGENRIPENFSTEKQYQGGNTLELMVQRTAQQLQRPPLGHLPPDRSSGRPCPQRRTGHPHPRLQTAQAARYPGNDDARRRGRREARRARCGEAQAGNVEALHGVQRRASRGPQAPRAQRSGRLPNGKRSRTWRKSSGPAGSRSGR